MSGRVVNTHYFVFDFVPYRFKSQKMCDKAVDNYVYMLEFVAN